MKKVSLLAAIVAFWILPANADIVINNGLAPPSPANVIDADDGSIDSVQVHNLGCDAVFNEGWVPADPCPMPWGESTGVEMVDGGMTGGVSAYESSTLTMSGGAATVLVAYDSSIITISGGMLQAELLVAWSSSTMQIVGTSFAVDAVPVGYGPLAQTQGVLTGTLESGEGILASFCHDGCSDYGLVPKGVFATGLITLAPEPDASRLLPVATLSLAALRVARKQAK
jgi:hypothetical protein